VIEFLIIMGLAGAYLVYLHRDDLELSLRISRTRTRADEIVKRIFKSRRAILVMAGIEIAIFLVIIYLGLTMKIFFAAVLSNSMSPTFERGDIVLVQTIFREPKEGDIVMFVSEEFGYSVTHRVLKVSGDKVYTGGDASGPDGDPIAKDAIIGKAILIFGKPIVVKGVGNYFILDVKEMRDIGPYGQEYLFYKKLIDAMRQYALAVIIIGISAYIYVTVREIRY